MNAVLNEYEVRVLGALVEKQLTTPDYYPLTLNALTTACNQKSHRDPVVAYDEATTMRALDSLRDRKLAYVFHGSDSRGPKYGHLFHKGYELEPAEVATLCVLMLRGPQTPGELRSRSAHLHSVEHLPEVESTLLALAAREQPLVVKLPRQTGTKESRYAHLLSGEVAVEESPSELRAEPAAVRGRAEHERLARLEAEVTALRGELADLSQQFAAFKKQFE